MAFDTKYDQHLEEGLLPVATDEKRGSTTSTTPRTPTKKMTGPRRFLFAFVVCGLVTLSLASVLSHQGRPCAREVNGQVSVTEGEPAKVDLLHRLLHAYFPDRYQDGVYASDKDAIAAVEADDADLASRLLALAKRQENGTASASATVASETPSASASASAEASTSAAQSPSSTPAATPTSSAAPAESTTAPRQESSSAPQQSSSTPQQNTAQSTQAEQTTPTTPATSAAPATSGTSQTEQAASPSSTTVGPSSAASSESSPTTPRTQQTSTTSTRPRSTSWSEVRSTFTSTASNGDVVLVTATSVVAVDAGPEATEASQSGGSNGGLQNGAVRPGSGSFALPLTFAAFVAGAMIML